uniref:Uncharacterized protein n=1 Tax=Amorphochlora amoebiformis TaxID=1561963 RepID=A0A0H5BIF0_9EUKA|nr:hypothetical protein [Amorphochlora amoebiformis]
MVSIYSYIRISYCKKLFYRFLRKSLIFSLKIVNIDTIIFKKQVSKKRSFLQLLSSSNNLSNLVNIRLNKKDSFYFKIKNQIKKDNIKIETILNKLYLQFGYYNYLTKQFKIVRILNHLGIAGFVDGTFIKFKFSISSIHILKNCSKKEIQLRNISFLLLSRISEYNNSIDLVIMTYERISNIFRKVNMYTILAIKKKTFFKMYSIMIANKKLILNLAEGYNFQLYK